MPSASSAKLAKISSVPVNATAVKSGVISSVTVADTIVTENATNPGLSMSLSSSNAVAAAAATTSDAAAAASSSTNSSSSAATNLASVVENHNANSITTPIKQTLIIIEHKIRNLEKRKTKLESYRAIQSSGKELSADQKQAVAKYDEVAQCLEFARDLTKQMIQLSNNAEKEQKKMLRREAILRAQAETLKIREVLTIQNILSHFADENVREDFLSGTNGATKMEENDLNILEKFYIDTNVKRQESPEDVPFMTNVQKAAELFSFTIDGRVKQYGDTTFENLRRIFQTIQDCGYFDQAGKVETIDDENFDEAVANEEQDDEQMVDTEMGTEQEQGEIDMVSDEIVQMQITQSQQPLAGHVEIAKFEAPSAAAVPAPAFPQSAMLQQQQQQPPTQQIISAAQIPQPQPGLQRPVMVSPVVPPAAGAVAGGQPPPVAQVPPAGVPAGATNQIHFPPTTVRAVEQGYYKQHQYIHQMRPLAEVIGSTNFYFLQESELDSPDIVAGGFTPNEAQAASGVMNPGVLPPQSPNTPGQPIIHQQQQPPSQQQQQPQPQSQIPMSQAGIPQKQQPVSAHNSQTFTNPAFPPNVPPPTNMLPQGTPNPDMAGTLQQHQQQQMPPVYPPQQQQQQPGGPGMPMQSMIPPPQTVVSQQQSQILNSMVDSQSMADAISQQAAANMAILMSGPSGTNVPLPGFPPNKFQQAQNPAMVGGHQQSANPMGNSDGLDQMQQSQQHSNDKKQPRDDIKDSRPKNDSEDWDAHEPHVQKSHTSIMSRTDDDSNQWSNDVANSNSSKQDWSSNYDSQNDSNTWKNVPNDSYNGRHAGRNNYSGSGNRTGGTGRGGGGMRGSNNSGNGGPPSNGYRGRSNNYPQQQGNRNAGMYFRNSDNSGGGGGGGYYQNQNGNTSGGGGYGNKDSSGNFTGNSGSGNNYRPRGGPMLSNNRQQSGGRVGGGPPNNNGGGPPQSARNGAGSGPTPNRSSNMGPGTGGMSSNPNTRPGGRNPGNTYGGSRPPPPPNNVRQQQDINA